MEITSEITSEMISEVISEVMSEAISEITPPSFRKLLFQVKKVMIFINIEENVYNYGRPLTKIIIVNRRLQLHVSCLRTRELTYFATFSAVIEKSILVLSSATCGFTVAVSGFIRSDLTMGLLDPDLGLTGEMLNSSPRGLHSEKLRSLSTLRYTAISLCSLAELDLWWDVSWASLYSLAEEERW